MIPRSLPRRFVVCLLALAALSCQSTMRSSEPGAAPSVGPSASAPPVVEVRATDYAFHAPSKLASGWTTFRMTNEGEEPHFLVFWLLPDGRTYDDYIREAYEPFMDLFGRYKSGELGRDEMLGQLGAALPEWLDLVAMGRGGPGFTSPGRTSVTTVELPPGSYVMECYMVNAEGKVHNQLGMLRPLTVTAEGTGATPPEADVELALSNEGIAIEGELGPGVHTVRVTVADAPPGLLGHDVHLARLGEEVRLEEVIPWMDWVDGLTPPAPTEFLGGAEQVPPGSSSYFTVELDPGRYAWISEGYAREGVVKEFQIE